MSEPRRTPGRTLRVTAGLSMLALLGSGCWGSHGRAGPSSPPSSRAGGAAGPAGPAASEAWTFPLAQGGENVDDVTDAVAVGPDGNVYLVDAGRSRVVVLSPDGQGVTSWGEAGTGRGEFDFEDREQRVLSSGIAVGPDGSVYVADVGNFRIQRFDGRGRFVTAWGSRGSAAGKFERLSGVVVDGAGHVLVTDSMAAGAIVQVFDASGTLVARWGTAGSGPGHIGSGAAGEPAIGPHGQVYIPDGDTGSVLAFDPSGRFLFGIGSPGSGPGQLNDPVDLAVDGEGNLFVVDHGNSRIEEFDPQGRFVATIGLEGTLLLSPASIAVGPGGELYVDDDVVSVLAKVVIGTPRGA